jgi:hypothetical protein
MPRPHVNAPQIFENISNRPSGGGVTQFWPESAGERSRPGFRRPTDEMSFMTHDSWTEHRAPYFSPPQLTPVAPPAIAPSRAAAPAPAAEECRADHEDIQAILQRYGAARRREADRVCRNLNLWDLISRRLR